MSWLDSIFLGDEVERGRELDAKIRDLNQAKYERGVLTADQRDAADANLARESAEVHSQQIYEDFTGGLNEGYQNVTGGIRSTLAAPFNFAFASIPWQLWLAGLVALAWYLGAFNNLRNRIKW